MSDFTLTGNHKSALRRASRRQIEDYFTKLPASIRSLKWLRDTNRYRYRCTARYARDLQASPPSVNHSQLTQYVSASAPAHLIDGWSCLGRAVEAALRGDGYAAVHFGYYAELRAAMSLLAAEGVGIFQNRHPIVDDLGVTHPFPTGVPTHKIVWPILRYWATLRRAADLLDDLVSPGSIRLSNWLIGTAARVPVRAIAQHWLGSWGLDLALADEDHSSRNLASYRPSEFRRQPPVPVHDLTTFVEELWQLFEPGVDRRFPNLERLLLRSARRKGTAIPPIVGDVERLGFLPDQAAEWVTYLQRTDDPRPLQLAEKSVPVEQADCHLRIISRAALLLFVSAAAVRRLLGNATYSAHDILFWWSRHGEDRALWNIGAAPGDPQDLWADIAQSISDSAKWRLNNPTSTASLRQWRRDQPGALHDFGGFELVGIWALMP